MENKYGYRPLIAGIDTLEIGYCIVEYLLSQSEWDMLTGAKLVAQGTLYEKGSAVKFRGYDFTVLRSGSGRYKLILTNNDLDIRIFVEAKSGKHFPELKIRFKSAFLWRNGYQAAVSKVDEWIRSWVKVSEVKVSRIDLMVDMVGDIPVFSPELEEVVSRAKNKTEYGIFISGKTVSGYRFGANELLCRIYNKILEVKSSGKTWFEYLWKERGWKEGEPVTRVEFQCRRKIIRQFGIGTLQDLIERIPDMWVYLAMEWLTIRTITSDSHRTRWPVSDFWLSVQSSVILLGRVMQVTRITQLRVRSKDIEIVAKSYMLNLIAISFKSLENADIQYAIRVVEHIVGKWIEEPGFLEEIEKRGHKYDSMEY